MGIHRALLGGGRCPPPRGCWQHDLLIVGSVTSTSSFPGPYWPPKPVSSRGQSPGRALPLVSLLWTAGPFLHDAELPGTLLLPDSVTQDRILTALNFRQGGASPIQASAHVSATECGSPCGVSLRVDSQGTFCRLPCSLAMSEAAVGLPVHQRWQGVWGWGACAGFECPPIHTGHVHGRNQALTLRGGSHCLPPPRQQAGAQQAQAPRTGPGRSVPPAPSIAGAISTGCRGESRWQLQLRMVC